MTTLTLTSIQWWFSPLKCLVELDMVNEDGFKIRHFDPYIGIYDKGILSNLIVHRLNPYGRAQPISLPIITKILCFNPTIECHILFLSSLRSKLVCIDINL